MLAASGLLVQDWSMAVRPPLYHLIDLWISLTRDLHAAANPRAREHFGAHINDLLIRSAVYLGTIEGRPMTAAKLATLVGIPRPTVVRHLGALEKRGMVESSGRFWLTPAEMIETRGKQDFSAIARMVRNAGARLQKL